MRAKRIELIFNGSYEISNVLDFAAIFSIIMSIDKPFLSALGVLNSLCAMALVVLSQNFCAFA